LNTNGSGYERCARRWSTCWHPRMNGYRDLVFGDGQSSFESSEVRNHIENAYRTTVVGPKVDMLASTDQRTRYRGRYSNRRQCLAWPGHSCLIPIGWKTPAIELRSLCRCLSQSWPESLDYLHRKHRLLGQTLQQPQSRLTVRWSMYQVNDQAFKPAIPSAHSRKEFQTTVE